MLRLFAAIAMLLTKLVMPTSQCIHDPTLLVNFILIHNFIPSTTREKVTQIRNMVRYIMHCCHKYDVWNFPAVISTYFRANYQRCNIANIYIVIIRH